jgi:tetratricopeptide (TPR) repeat protein
MKGRYKAGKRGFEHDKYPAKVERAAADALALDFGGAGSESLAAASEMNLANSTNAPAAPDGPNQDAGSAFGRDISGPKFRDGLVMLAVLGLIVRGGFLVEHAQNPSFGVLTLDQKYYDTVARMLVAGQDLHTLHGFRPLLYPMFLAFWYKLVGSHGVDFAVVAQHLLGVATGLLVALLGARLFRHRLCGVIGGVLFMLAPVPLYFEGEVLIESSYTFLICVVLLLHLRAANAAGWRAGLLWTLGGALTILAAQARANFLVFMAVYPVFAAWRWWGSRRPDALLPLLGLAGGVLMAIPWGFINENQSGGFQWLPSAGGVNLYLGNRRTADGMVPEQARRVTYGERYEDSVEVWAREEYESAMRAEHRQPETDALAVSKYWTHRAFGEIRAAPVRWLGLIAKKCWLTLWNAEIPNNKAFAFLQQEYLWLRLLPVRWVVLLMLAPAGIWAALKWGNRDALLILMVYAFLYSAANVAFFICDRYRYPVWPAMAAIGGGGVLALVEALRRGRFRTGTGILASMALMALISLPNWFDAELPSFSRDYLFRSISWYEKGSYGHALSDVDRSLELDPGEVTALHHRGNVLFALHRYAEADVDFEQALKFIPEDSGIWNNYGVSLSALGRTNEALQALNHAISCKPPSKNAFLQIAFIQIRLNHPDAAAAILDQLERVDPEPNAAALAIRSVLARKRGDIPQADALERQARSLDDGAAAWAIIEALKPGS